MKFRNVDFTLPFGERRWRGTVYAWLKQPQVAEVFAVDEWQARERLKMVGAHMFGVDKSQLWVENLVSIEADPEGGSN